MSKNTSLAQKERHKPFIHKAFEEASSIFSSGECVVRLSYYT